MLSPRRHLHVTNVLDCLFQDGHFEGFITNCDGVVCPLPPPNDECENAILVNVPSLTPGSTEFPAQPDFPPECGGILINISGSVWYRVIGADDTAVIRWNAGGGGGPPEVVEPEDVDRLITWLRQQSEPTGGSETGDDAPPGSPAPLGPGQDRVSGTEKGSLVIFPKVEPRWTEMGTLVQDTFLSLTNDYPGEVRVQMYFINGDPPRAGGP